MVKNYGLIIPEIKSREEGAEHLLGSLGKPIINESGDWTSFWPRGEAQKRLGVETNGCTVWATLNAIEALVKFRTGIEVNYSDRYLANAAKFKGILNPAVGADPHKIAELIRTVAGCLKEERLPWSDEIKTSADYYDVQDLAQLMREGPRWFDEWILNYEWIFKEGNKEQEMKDALNRGTVCASVEAWIYDGARGWYTKSSPVARDTHWTGVMRYDGRNPIVGDSYPETEGDFEKVLAPGYNFLIAKVYYLEPAGPTLGILQKILQSIRNWISSIAEQIDKLDKPAIVQPARKSRIKEWALAIKKAEGWFVLGPKYPNGSRSYRNNNPGNLKSSMLVQSFGGYEKTPKLAGFLKSDGDGFAIFDTYENGFTALCDFLTLAVEDKLKPYRNTRTLVLFTRVYANPPDDNYAKSVADALGVPIDIPIKELA